MLGTCLILPSVFIFSEDSIWGSLCSTRNSTVALCPHSGIETDHLVKVALARLHHLNTPASVCNPQVIRKPTNGSSLKPVSLQF